MKTIHQIIARHVVRNSFYGFTLMEILIVIALLGIIASLSLGSYTTAQRKGWDVQRKQNLEGLRQALELYYNDHGKYPPADFSNGQIRSCDGVSCSWGGGPMNDVSDTLYMRQLPKDPRDKNWYYYRTDLGQSTFQVYTCLENTQDPKRTENGFSGTNCGTCIETDPSLCNYGISSPNTTP